MGYWCHQLSTMNRTITIVMASLLVVAAIGAVPLAGVAQETTGASDNNESEASAGERLTGVIGVQAAELEGEVDRRTFGIKIARAASNESRADVVRENLDAVEARLTELEERKRGLEQAKANGSISNGSYDAQTTVIAAQTANAQSQLNASENASEGLPVELLESKGINVSAIQTLKHNASELTGPEVAAIAKTIAGPDVGKSLASERAPVSVGPPDDVGPSTSGTSAGNVTGTEERPDGPPNGSTGTDEGQSPGNSEAGNPDT